VFRDDCDSKTVVILLVIMIIQPPALFNLIFENHKSSCFKASVSTAKVAENVNGPK